MKERGEKIKRQLKKKKKKNRRKNGVARQKNLIQSPIEQKKLKLFIKVRIKKKEWRRVCVYVIDVKEYK